MLNFEQQAIEIENQLQELQAKLAELNKRKQTLAKILPAIYVCVDNIKELIAQYPEEKGCILSNLIEGLENSIKLTIRSKYNPNTDQVSVIAELHADSQVVKKAWFDLDRSDFKEDSDIHE